MIGYLVHKRVPEQIEKNINILIMINHSTCIRDTLSSRARPFGRVHARANVSCIQSLD